MQTSTSKELYMMNGGQKLYICKDGFGDIYNASPAEEALWAAEVTDRALIRVAKETNRTNLQFAVADLAYHKYENIAALLLENINDSNPVRQIVFASELWKREGYEKGFDIIIKNLIEKRNDCLDDVFLALNDFKDHTGAKHFLINCLEGSDDELTTKAQYTLSMWAWSGLPQLRENNLLEELKVENKNGPVFKPAIKKLKQILNITK